MTLVKYMNNENENENNEKNKMISISISTEPDNYEIICVCQANKYI